MITMPTETLRVIKGAPEETELAALVAVLHVLSQPTPARISDPASGAGRPSMQSTLEAPSALLRPGVGLHA